MREKLDAIWQAFENADARGRRLLSTVPDKLLFASSGLRGRQSVGEHLIRSAAVVEQTFGGITTRLWDDPFEWTLPETLFDRAAITEYFDEVAVTRNEGFKFFESDDTLLREIPSPVAMRSLDVILNETLDRAAFHHDRADEILRSLITPAAD